MSRAHRLHAGTQDDAISIPSSHSSGNSVTSSSRPSSVASVVYVRAKPPPPTRPRQLPVPSETSTDYVDDMVKLLSSPGHSAPSTNRLNPNRPSSSASRAGPSTAGPSRAPSSPKARKVKRVFDETLVNGKDYAPKKRKAARNVGPSQSTIDHFFQPKGSGGKSDPFDLTVSDDDATPVPPSRQNMRSSSKDILPQFPGPVRRVQMDAAAKARQQVRAAQPASSKPIQAGPSRASQAGPSRASQDGPSRTSHAGPSRTASQSSQSTTQRQRGRSRTGSTSPWHGNKRLPLDVLEAEFNRTSAGRTATTPGIVFVPETATTSASSQRPTQSTSVSPFRSSSSLSNRRKKDPHPSNSFLNKLRRVQEEDSDTAPASRKMQDKMSNSQTSAARPISGRTALSSSAAISQSRHQDRLESTASPVKKTPTPTRRPQRSPSPLLDDSSPDPLQQLLDGLCEERPKERSRGDSVSQRGQRRELQRGDDISPDPLDELMRSDLPSGSPHRPGLSLAQLGRSPTPPPRQPTPPRHESPSPPPAPISALGKRRRALMDMDEESFRPSPRSKLGRALSNPKPKRADLAPTSRPQRVRSEPGKYTIPTMDAPWSQWPTAPGSVGSSGRKSRTSEKKKAENTTTSKPVAASSNEGIHPSRAKAASKTTTPKTQAKNVSKPILKGSSKTTPAQPHTARQIAKSRLSEPGPTTAVEESAESPEPGPGGLQRSRSMSSELTPPPPTQAQRASESQTSSPLSSLEPSQHPSSPPTSPSLRKTPSSNDKGRPSTDALDAELEADQHGSPPDEEADDFWAEFDEYQDYADTPQASQASQPVAATPSNVLVPATPAKTLVPATPGMSPSARRLLQTPSKRTPGSAAKATPKETPSSRTARLLAEARKREREIAEDKERRRVADKEQRERLKQIMDEAEDDAEIDLDAATRKAAKLPTPPVRRSTRVRDASSRSKASEPEQPESEPEDEASLGLNKAMRTLMRHHNQDVQRRTHAPAVARALEPVASQEFQLSLDDMGVDESHEFDSQAVRLHFGENVFNDAQALKENHRKAEEMSAEACLEKKREEACGVFWKDEQGELPRTVPQLDLDDPAVEMIVGVQDPTELTGLISCGFLSGLDETLASAVARWLFDLAICTDHAELAWAATAQLVEMISSYNSPLGASSALRERVEDAFDQVGAGHDSDRARAAVAICNIIAAAISQQQLNAPEAEALLCDLVVLAVDASTTPVVGRTIVDTTNVLVATAMIDSSAITLASRLAAEFKSMTLYCRTRAVLALGQATEPVRTVVRYLALELLLPGSLETLSPTSQVPDFDRLTAGLDLIIDALQAPECDYIDVLNYITLWSACVSDIDTLVGTLFDSETGESPRQAVKDVYNALAEAGNELSDHTSDSIMMAVKSRLHQLQHIVKNQGGVAIKRRAAGRLATNGLELGHHGGQTRLSLGTA